MAKVSRAQALHHLDELECADVRVRGDEDFLRRAGRHELLHHLAPEVARVLDLAVELAVREGAGAAFAELHIALGVELAPPPQGPGVLRAFAHRLAALQHDGPETHLRQHQRREDAAGTEADHHRALRQRRRCVADGAPGHVGRPLDVRVGGVVRQQRRLLRRVGQGQVDDVDRQQLPLARVEAALEQLELGNLGRRDAEQLGAGLAQRGFGGLGLREWQADF